MMVKATGISVMLASGLPDQGGLALDEDQVYWSESWNGRDGLIRSVQKDGTGTRTLASSAAPGRLAVDSSFLYWIDHGAPDVRADGQVLRVPKRGGEREVLAHDQAAPSDIVLAEGAVYWTTMGQGWPDSVFWPDGEVLRLSIE